MAPTRGKRGKTRSVFVATCRARIAKKGGSDSRGRSRATSKKGSDWSFARVRVSSIEEVPNVTGIHSFLDHLGTGNLGESSL